MEIIDLHTGFNRRFLNSLSFNKESIYDVLYDADSSDDENLRTVSDRLHVTIDDIGADTSHEQDKEDLRSIPFRPDNFSYKCTN